MYVNKFVRITLVKFCIFSMRKQQKCLMKLRLILEITSEDANNKCYNMKVHGTVAQLVRTSRKQFVRLFEYSAVVELDKYIRKHMIKK